MNMGSNLHGTSVDFSQPLSTGFAVGFGGSTSYLNPIIKLNPEFYWDYRQPLLTAALEPASEGQSVRRIPNLVPGGPVVEQTNVDLQGEVEGGALKADDVDDEYTLPGLNRVNRPLLVGFIAKSRSSSTSRFDSVHMFSLGAQNSGRQFSIMFSNSRLFLYSLINIEVVEIAGDFNGWNSFVGWIPNNATNVNQFKIWVNGTYYPQTNSDFVSGAPGSSPRLFTNANTNRGFAGTVAATFVRNTAATEDDALTLIAELAKITTSLNA